MTDNLKVPSESGEGDSFQTDNDVQSALHEDIPLPSILKATKPEEKTEDEPSHLAVDGPVIYGDVEDNLENTSEIGKKRDKPSVGFVDDIENPLDNSHSRLK